MMRNAFQRNAFLIYCPPRLFLFCESSEVNPLSLRIGGFSAPSRSFRWGLPDEFGNAVINDPGDRVHRESVVGSVSGRMV
jgi:hypothetical protein